MEVATEALKTALRVLTAVSEKKEPDPADVDELKRLSPLLADSSSLDEMACDVILQAMKRRDELRKRLGNQAP